MQTQCPHCETRFRVTESQVNTADGFVRCSVCEEVFNAFDIAEQHKHQQSLLNHEHLTDEPVVKQTANTDINEKPEHSEDNEQQNDINKDAVDVEAINFNKTPTTADSRKDAFDFFDEEDNESLSHVVPEIYKESYADNSTNFLPNLLWGISALLLTTTLVFEYVWFNRDQLNQMPQLQTWAEQLCQHIECKNITMRNPAKIKLVSRNVYSHPNEKNALMVNITMKNQADFAQPYPVMQIKFSDIRGGNIAARRFLPSEYLPAEMQQQTAQQLFEPDTNMTFTMEIQDPGKQATAYEFDFL